MGTQGIDRLRALPDREITGVIRYRRRLPGLALHRDKPMIGICHVVLLSLHERLRVGGRDQSDAVAEIADRAAPMASARASFHRHDAGLPLAHELQQLRTRQLAPECNGPVRSGAVRLEHVPGQIQAGDANLFHGQPPRSGASTPATLAQSMPPGGAAAIQIAIIIVTCAPIRLVSKCPDLRRDTRGPLGGSLAVYTNMHLCMYEQVSRTDGQVSEGGTGHSVSRRFGR
jgi:hypothetical protein